MNDIDWIAMSAPWLKAEKGLENAHQVVLDSLMTHAKLQPGQRVLDVGCGTGPSLLAAASAVGDTGHVTGIDIAPPLVTRAKERVPHNVDVLVGDGGSAIFDQPFDAAISLFGTMFFADTHAAFASLRRAVAPGASFVFAAWGTPANNPWFIIPRGSIEAQIGPLPELDPAAPGPFRFANAEATKRIIQSAGWTVSVETETVTLETGQNADGLAEMHLNIAKANLLKNKVVNETDGLAIRRNLCEGFGKLLAGDVVNVPAEVHFYVARPSG